MNYISPIISENVYFLWDSIFTQLQSDVCPDIRNMLISNIQAYSNLLIYQQFSGLENDLVFRIKKI